MHQSRTVLIEVVFLNIELSFCRKMKEKMQILDPVQMKKESKKKRWGKKVEQRG